MDAQSALALAPSRRDNRVNYKGRWVYVVDISISDFLDRALSISDGQAHASAEFAGLAVLIARTADAEAVQDRLFEQWESLNDLTDRRVLFITANAPPKNGQRGSADGVTVAGGDDGLVVRVPALRASPAGSTYDWQREFHAKPVRPHEVEEEEPGMVHESPPGEKSELKAAITRTASDLADFFGLSELDLPCLALLSMWEHKLYVISLSRGFDLYDFFKRVVIHYDERGGGPTTRLRELRKADQRMIDLRDRIAKTRRHVDQARSKLTKEQASWKHHRDDARGLLRWLAKHAPSRADEARNIETWIETESALDDGHLTIIDGLIGYVQADPSLSSTKAGFDLCRRLDEIAQRLGGATPRAIAREMRPNELPDIAPLRPLTAAELDELIGTDRPERQSDLEIADELEQELAGQQAEIDQLANRMRQLEAEIRDPRLRTGFSEAVSDAASELKLDTDPTDRGWWRPGWARAFVRQADAPRRLASTLK